MLLARRSAGCLFFASRLVTNHREAVDGLAFGAAEAHHCWIKWMNCHQTLISEKTMIALPANQLVGFDVHNGKSKSPLHPHAHPVTSFFLMSFLIFARTSLVGIPAGMAFSTDLLPAISIGNHEHPIPP